MSQMPQASCREIASLLLAHRWLQDRGYDLRSLRFDRSQRACGRIRVGLVWRRPSDRDAAVRHATLTRAQASELLLGLGGFSAL